MASLSSTASFAASLALALAGCGQPGTQDEAPPGEIRSAYEQDQGEYLTDTSTNLGSTFAVLSSGATDSMGVAYDSVMARNGQVLAIRGGYTYGGSSLIGAHLIGSNSPSAASQDYYLTITDVKQHYFQGVAQPGEFDYLITYHSFASPGNEMNLCVDSSNLALPFASYWLSNGAQAVSSTTLSFACVGGVIRKCSDWGYKPWKWISGTTTMASYHQSCTRMARADYCSNGQSYTIQSTPIDLYDAMSMNTETDPPIFPQEAIWGIDKGIDRPALMCLSKKRWDTIPFKGPCQFQLPDPRVVRTAHFCDDFTWPEWVAKGALLGNDSAFIDEGLFRWDTASDNWTSAAYPFRGGAQLPPNGTPPGGYAFVAFEGATYRQDPVAGGYLPPGSTTALLTWYSPSRGDYYTGTANPNGLLQVMEDPFPYDYTVHSTEGYVLTASNIRPHSKLLSTWYSPSRYDYLTTVGSPSPPSNNDYYWVRIEGWVIYKQ